MKAPVAPRLERRRTADFLAELRERARAWIPEWDLSDAQGDFGQALLDVSARFSSEVAECLDQAAGKMRGGFLDWLGVRGKAARPARVPVVFKLSDSAPAPVDAIAPIRLQASTGPVPVVFETEKSLTIVPAKLQMIVAADPAGDAYFLPPPDLSSLAAIDHLPTQWIVKTFAPAGATSLQLMPGVGLLPEMVIELNNRQYTVKAADQDLIMIDRPLETAADKNTQVDKVTSFTPFDPAAADQQEHILYIGDADLLNVEAAAIIGVQNAAGLRSSVTWAYWGKNPKLSDSVDWQDLTPSAVQDQPGILLLEKPAGSMEQRDIDGRNARWIRAYTKKVDQARQPFTTSQLAIEINPSKPCQAGDCPPSDGTPSIQADGMANTTPLVLDNLFYPLGKEPHQFDAFYLGSNEAFSKADANVQLCFEMADRTFNAISAVRSPTFGLKPVLLGVGQDRALHLFDLDPSSGKASPFRGRPPLYPPSPRYGAGPQPGSAISLDKDPVWRPPVWAFPMGFVTAVCAGSSVWLWQEHLLFFPSGWVPFGEIPSTTTLPSNITSLIALKVGPSTTLFALRDSKLYARNWPPPSPDWSEVPTTSGPTTIRLVSVVAVRRFNAAFDEIGTADMVGLDGSGKLFKILANGSCTRLMAGHTFDPAILPAAVEVAGKLMVAAVIADPSDLKLIVVRGAAEVQAPTIAKRKALRALEPVLDGGTLHVLLTSSDTRPDSNTQALNDWVPFNASWNPKNDLFEVAIDIAAAGGSPTKVDGIVVMPGKRADVLSATYDAKQRFESTAQIDAGIVVSSAFSFLVPGDFITRVDSSGAVKNQQIKTPGVMKDGEILFGLKGGFPSDSTRLDAFPQAKAFTGSKNGTRWELDPNDHTTIAGSYIQIGLATPKFYRVDHINSQGRAKLKPPAPATPAGTPNYVPGWITNGRAVPVMNTVPGSWKADALDRPIGFPDNDPSTQSAKAFADASNHPTLLAFEREFNNPPAHPFQYGSTYKFVIEAAVGTWNRDAGSSANSPELSWEYWNGKGWSRLKLDRDETLNLQITGAVQFKVPTDLVPSDWAGKTNPWIRARLIGGDYGREKFVTIGTTTTRSTDDIHPPSVVNLTISYQLCTAVLPTFVLTSDSGSFLDQSNANRSASANVEAFVPLALTLGRLLLPDSVADSAANPCPPPCDCPGETKVTSAPGPAPGPRSAPARTTSATATAAIDASPFLLIGIEGTLSGSDVHLLVLAATEHDHARFAPLEVDAIVQNRFTPIVASDGTHALGESGLIEMSFADPPAKTDLFGKSLIWLRLLPRPEATVKSWQPAIGGMYLNAVFAKSTETLTRELLGSADGSPNLKVTLARPPVLAGTLELRVREPLGDQDLADLAGLVVTEGTDYWVKWSQVDDTADQPAAARVYAFEESTGEIRFGDGVHGMIPPVGRDSIVAFGYQRTEPPAPGSDVVPANGIPARTTLNLVSPVDSVESVTTADDSAGGAAPETPATVLQFGYARLRHRERALTLQDFEDLALESSPSIVQARAFQLSRGRVQVTVVMRGNPLPTLSEIRELRRYLLSKAPSAFALPGRLTIAPPGLRELRIELELDVLSLDAAAQVSADVKTQLKALFDTATGNLTRDGWALGLDPPADVVASAVGSVPDLSSIASLQLFEIDAKGNKLPWPTQIKPTDLVVLADDPVRLVFHSLEVAP
jgi:hypothetical protein